MTYEQQLHQADCDLAARSVTAEELAMLRHHFAKTRATNPINDHPLHWTEHQRASRTLKDLKAEACAASKNE